MNKVMIPKFLAVALASTLALVVPATAINLTKTVQVQRLLKEY